MGQRRRRRTKHEHYKRSLLFVGPEISGYQLFAGGCSNCFLFQTQNKFQNKEQVDASAASHTSYFPALVIVRVIKTVTVIKYHPDCGGPRVVVSTAAGLGGLKETKLFLPHPRVKVSIVRSLRDREVACSASDRQGSNFESCVWRTVSSQSSHHPQEVLLAQFSLYVHKGGLKPDSFHLFAETPVSLFLHKLRYRNVYENMDTGEY